jgi:hypothetical protein
LDSDKRQQIASLTSALQKTIELVEAGVYGPTEYDHWRNALRQLNAFMVNWAFGD